MKTPKFRTNDKTFEECLEEWEAWLAANDIPITDEKRRKDRLWQELVYLDRFRPKVVHCRKDDTYDVYIGRPSKWGNPFTHIRSRPTGAKHIVNTREEAINAYRKWITKGEGKHLLNDLHELKGKKLGCWCKPKACHGDVLAELVDKKFKSEI